MASNNNRKKWKNTQLESGENICYLCGQICSKQNSNVDHMIPLSKGGKDNPSNWRVTHIKCNSKKSNHIVNDYLSRNWNGKKVRRYT